jgi:hypothetical protein
VSVGHRCCVGGDMLRTSQLLPGLLKCCQGGWLHAAAAAGRATEKLVGVLRSWMLMRSQAVVHMHRIEQYSSCRSNTACVVKDDVVSDHDLVGIRCYGTTTDRFISTMYDCLYQYTLQQPQLRGRRHPHAGTGVHFARLRFAATSSKLSSGPPFVLLFDKHTWLVHLLIWDSAAQPSLGLRSRLSCVIGSPAPRFPLQTLYRSTGSPDPV